MAAANDQMGKLREQRDRFVAFAFAGAEALIELDKDETITYCAGATEYLLGSPPEKLIGHSLVELVAVDDQFMHREMMHRIQSAGRMDRMLLHFQRIGIPPLKALVSGIAFPDRPGTIYLTVSRAHSSDLQGDGRRVEAPARSKEEFALLAEKRMQEAARFGDDVLMTLIDLNDSSLSERLDSQAAGNFMQNVESYLRAWSVGGNSIGVLEDNKFGIIHDKTLKTDQVTNRIADIAALFDPTGAGVEVSASTLDLGSATLTEEDISKALVYTLNQFVSQGGEQFAVKSLTESYQKSLDETLAKVNAFRQTISSDAFTLVYQPIVDLRAWQVHHYEALARMMQGDRLFLPARFIGFAEDFGVVNEFDIMVVKKAIAALRANKVLRPKAEIAVNLSGKSLSSDAFVQQLLLLLVENRDVLSRMMFEVTESSELKDLEAANKVLQKLRSFGCKISIDDFGAGAAAFNYLKCLQVDYVKIDGSYILDAFRTRHGKPFLKAIAALSRDMGIQSIGEMVEDNRTMWLLREVGVEFGQGYFFGRPMPDASAFELAARPEFKAEGIS